MKISKILFASALIASSLILGSCGDDDESPSFEQSEFYGTWELTGSTDSEFKECPDNPPVLVISESSIKFPVISTDNGCNSGSYSSTYTFNGKTFEITEAGISFDYTIKSKSETEFAWVNFYDETETWVKK
ncbi:hypothetical protein [Fulvivirga ligni]|uniref:hypothetical protein n=1 Tax=Fulvivirga ligni TaxID=2904246 RepID=UPI001F40A8C3|nr:hypothetical protein [Fulvivirga ligni]UII19832.1 hypothetical protein LVD16_18480 [Fulvivirga ligni]